jgi:hypothetical protein
MGKRAEMVRPTVEKPRRKKLSTEASVGRMGRVADWQQPQLQVIKRKTGTEKRLLRATVSREESVRRLKHIEEYMDEWIKRVTAIAR